MKSSKKQKIHDWVLDSKDAGMLGYFLYRCRGCGFKTPNGVPLPMPQKEVCDKT